MGAATCGALVAPEGIWLTSAATCGLEVAADSDCVNEYEKLGSSVDYLSSVTRIKALELPERERTVTALVFDANIKHVYHCDKPANFLVGNCTPESVRDLPGERGMPSAVPWFLVAYDVPIEQGYTWADEPQPANPDYRNEAVYSFPRQQTPRVSSPPRPAGLSRWPYQAMSPEPQWPSLAVSPQSPATPSVATMPCAMSPQGVTSWWPYPSNYGAYMSDRPRQQVCRSLSSLSQSASDLTSPDHTSPQAQSRQTGKTDLRSLLTRQYRTNISLFAGVFLFVVIAIVAFGVYIAVSKSITTTTTTTTTPVQDFERLTGNATLKGLKFIDDYNDKTSTEYKKLELPFRQHIADVLRGSNQAQWYDTCRVNGFSPGSVIVHYLLIVVRSSGDTDSKTLEERWQSALELGRPNSTLKIYLDTQNATLTFDNLRFEKAATTPVAPPPVTRKSVTTATPGDTSGTTTPSSEITTATTAGTTTTGGTTTGTTTTGSTLAGTTTTGATSPGTTTTGTTNSGTTTTGITTSGTATSATTTTGCTTTGSTTTGSTSIGTTSVEASPETVTTDTSPKTTETATTGVDACASQPCQNGGTCTQDDDGYKCTCPVCGCSQGGNSPTCHRADDICVNKTQSIPHPHNCHKYVTCVNSAIAAVFECSGDLVFNPDQGDCAYLADTPCAQPVVPETTPVVVKTTADTRTCSSVTCLNGGTCEDTSPGVRCLCPSTHTGSTCETEIVLCAKTTCQHGANCSDGSSGFHCDCPAGYSGLHCETEIDECASSPCLHASTCVDNVNGYTCLCGHHCGCANQAAGPNCEKDPVTCDGFRHGDYIPDPDNCALSHRCLLVSGGLERRQPGVANCTSGSVFVQEPQACVNMAACTNYTYFHTQP
ncbi:hypothetical protein LSAT2_001202 [Lamellibrachia satsuma]|nr:hypothetical protein LSAT2_001202 [Lamellibrachia satsuma]